MYDKTFFQNVNIFVVAFSFDIVPQVMNVSRSLEQPEEVTVIFYTTEDGRVVTAAEVSAVYEDLGIAKISAGLGFEVSLYNSDIITYCAKRDYYVVFIISRAF